MKSCSFNWTVFWLTVVLIGGAYCLANMMGCIKPDFAAIRITPNETVPELATVDPIETSPPETDGAPVKEEDVSYRTIAVEVAMALAAVAIGSREVRKFVKK